MMYANLTDSLIISSPIIILQIYSRENAVGTYIHQNCTLWKFGNGSHVREKVLKKHLTNKYLSRRSKFMHFLK